MKTNPSQNKELFVFKKEPIKKHSNSIDTSTSWNVLIVDDDSEVHIATEFAFKGFSYSNRGINFINAYSAIEAKKILRENKEIACIFLDVVMESENSGLDLVSYIRNSLYNDRVRIILRTGQPGYAPAVDVIQKYDINDYKEKSELTKIQLYICLIAALRCYQQLCTIESSRHGIEMVINATSALIAMPGIKQFSVGVLTQLCGLLGIRPEGIVCIQSTTSEKDCQNLVVIAAAGKYSDYIGLSLDSINNSEIVCSISKTLKRKINSFEKGHNYIYIPLSENDSIIVLVDTVQPLNGADTKLLEIFGINISISFKNVKLFEQLESLAYFDQLTKLPNRESFLLSIRKKIDNNSSFYIILADIDNFENINDGLGENIGNKFLLFISKILQSFIKDILSVARLGGDLFGLLLFSKNNDMIKTISRKIVEYFEHPIDIDGNLISASISLGIYHYNNSKISAKETLSNANIALKHSKQKLRGRFCFFEDWMNKELKDRLHIIKDLHHAIDYKQLYLLYQPQVNLIEKKITGVESLLRWRKENGLIIPPEQFIPPAEESGLIVSIGKFVLQESIKMLERFSSLGLNIKVSVNISPRQLIEIDFVEHVENILAESTININLLEFEITETIIMNNPELVIEKLERFRKIGIKIAVDDFGTGYSSLGYLQSLPVDRLKIDGTFIRNIDSKKEDKSIAAMIINMGHELNLKVLAECIETPHQEKILLALSCDEGQGYLFGKPLDEENLITLIKN